MSLWLWVPASLLSLVVITEVAIGWLQRRRRRGRVRLVVVLRPKPRAKL